MFVGNGELFATACTARSQYATTILGCHSLTEAVFVNPSTIVGLKCSFHCFIFLLLYSRFGLQKYAFLFKQPNVFITIPRARMVFDGGR